MSMKNVRRRLSILITLTFQLLKKPNIHKIKYYWHHGLKKHFQNKKNVTSLFLIVTAQNFADVHKNSFGFDIKL